MELSEEQWNIAPSSSIDLNLDDGLADTRFSFYLLSKSRHTLFLLNAAVPTPAIFSSLVARGSGGEPAAQAFNPSRGAEL